MLLTEKHKKVLRLLVDAFNKSNIKFQASGGLGAIAYGGTRPLYDIDLEIYTKDAERVRELFKDYLTTGWHRYEENKFDLWLMCLRIDGISVDINGVDGSVIIAQGGEHVLQPEKMKTEKRIVEGIEIPVQDKDAFIAYKRLLARDTDLQYVRETPASS